MTDEGGSSMAETIVKEAVGMGLESPMRDSILDAVDEAEGRGPSSVLPLVGGALAVGAGIGYLLGTQEVATPRPEGESVPVDLPAKESVAPGEEAGERETDGGGGRLGKLLALLAVAAGVAYLNRRRSESEEGWEPVEEIDSAVDEVGEDVEAAVTGDEEGGGDVSGEEETDEDGDAGMESDDGEETGADETSADEETEE
ncbi:DNA polymerase V family protein [Halovivax limisalsi]|uniref:DNA polymerase V family protein n=1 Tax=Halovivax limisalsi TaxID=1453760 RepID=UPI001FFDACDB|nr:DNA polymerase V family protein [Halovivax limisalsi]